MSQTFQQPLVLHFIWHPDDAKKITPFLQGIKKMLARDTDRPFSRELNIPVFFWNTIEKDVFLNQSPYSGKKILIFPFISINTNGNDEWKAFYKSLPCKGPQIGIVPISIEKGVFPSGGAMKNQNAIRIFDWDKKDTKTKELLFDVAIAHAIYSFTYSKKRRSKNISPLILFLSHRKKGEFGEKLAQKIVEYVNTETTIKTFFDKTEILPGEEFYRKILKLVDVATLILFETDFYSASHWCQIEVSRAKKTMRPIVSVDFRSHFEDRIFPGCSNIPCLHIQHDILELEKQDAEKEYLRILEAALVETIRCFYNLSVLTLLKRAGRFPPSSRLLIRPPELSDLETIRNKSQHNCIVYYPDPPVFFEESNWYSKSLLDARTPLWNNKNSSEFLGMRCGISVSEPDKEEFGEMLKIGHTPDSIQRLVQDISRHLLARGATLIYGGDLRPCDESGFTEFILNEAKALREKGIKNFPKIENYLAWPLSIDGPALRRFKSEYDDVLKIQKYACPKIKDHKIDQQKYIQPNTVDNRHIWALSLTLMRGKMISKSDLRICAGGRRFGYCGAMPGVLEEVLESLSKGIPLYLLGGFGGITHDIVALVCKKTVSEPLTERWQCNNTRGYGKLLKLLSDSGKKTDYENIVNYLKNMSIKDLANRSGLTVKEYSILMHSPFIDECLFLIFKGIRKIHDKSKKGKR